MGRVGNRGQMYEVSADFLSPARRKMRPAGRFATRPDATASLLRATDAPTGIPVTLTERADALTEKPASLTEIRPTAGRLYFTR